MSKSRKEVKPTDTEAAVRLKGEVGDFKTKIAGEAQKIVHEIFPGKVRPALRCLLVADCVSLASEDFRTSRVPLCTSRLHSLPVHASGHR